MSTMSLFFLYLFITLFLILFLIVYLSDRADKRDKQKKELEREEERKKKEPVKLARQKELSSIVNLIQRYRHAIGHPVLPEHYKLRYPIDTITGEGWLDNRLLEEAKKELDDVCLLYLQKRNERFEGRTENV